MRASVCCVLALALLFSTGCAQNAALEVTLGLPAAPTDPTAPHFVLVQPRRASENPFGDEWRGDDLPAIELVTGEPIEDKFSVLSDDEETDLHLKVRFCVNATCTDLADDMAPERWFFLEHPFYIGEPTYWSATIDAVPTVTDSVPTEVGRCDIRGCVAGDLSMYCRADDRHLCE